MASGEVSEIFARLFKLIERRSVGSGRKCQMLGVFYVAILVSDFYRESKIETAMQLKMMVLLFGELVNFSRILWPCCFERKTLSSAKTQNVSNFWLDQEMYQK